MPTSFPTNLDTFTNPDSATDDLDTAGVNHDDQHADANDAIEALQAKVGIVSSAVATSLDYLVNHLGGDLSGTLAAAQLVSGAVGTTELAALAVTDAKVATANKDGSAATPSMRTLGTGAAQATAGNDARLSDARTPTTHSDSVHSVDYATQAELDTHAGAADPHAGYVLESLLTAKGQVVGASASATPAAVPALGADESHYGDAAQSSGIVVEKRLGAPADGWGTDVWSPAREPGAVGTAAATANRADLVLFVVFRRITVTHVAVNITTSSGNLDVGIYDDDGASGAPATRLASSGSVATPGTGTRQIALSAAVTLAPGVYWAAVATDNGTMVYRASDSYVSIYPARTIYYQKTTSFPLPSSIATPSAIAQNNVYIFVPVRA